MSNNISDRLARENLREFFKRKVKPHLDALTRGKYHLFSIQNRYNELKKRILARYRKMFEIHVIKVSRDTMILG